MMETPIQPVLADLHRRVHRALIEGVLTTGSVPTVEALAAHLAQPEKMLRSSLATLEEADYLSLDRRGEVSCLYPFSAEPTPHVVRIDGQVRHAMCAIDALGIAAMLDRELDLESRCAACTTPITVRVRPGAIASATPLTTMVVARRVEDEPAFAACCPFTVFVCGQDHAGQFMRRIPGTHALSLEEALVRAEEIFGDLLADAIPAKRPRGRRWEQTNDV